MKNINITLVAISTLLVACADEEISCSSNTVRGLVNDIIKRELRKDVNLQYGFNVDKSEYVLSGIRTIGDTNTGHKCGAMLNIQFELTDQLKEIQKNDPDKFQSMMSNNFREYNNNRRELPLNYTVEKTDDNQIYVELQL